MEKKIKIENAEMKNLVEPMGTCIATDRVTVDGKKVGYMYREEPDDNLDSGWRFLAGTESQKYVDNPENSGIYEVNVLANLDPAIMPYLLLPFNTELVRVEGADEFKIVE
jgi:hypothetical protein